LLANGSAIWAIRKEIDFANVSDSSSPEEIQAALDEVLEEFLATDGRQELLDTALATLADGADPMEAIGAFIQQNLRVEGLETPTHRTGRFVLSRSSSKVGLGKLIIGYNQ
jgi:DNA-binding NarL/FixJ family response regulator